MKRKTHFLPAAGLLAVMTMLALPPARAESPALLLEKGVFAEETKGDIDAAIKIYKQIIEDAKANRKHVAQAHYRLGTCLLKKKQYVKAEAVFGELVAEFPEEAKLVAQAQKQLRQARSQISGAELSKIVDQAVMTISTCAETDPRVKPALDSLAGLNEPAVVKELTKHLESEKNTVRRSAVYILWKGAFSEITAAEAGLTKLCKHEEGMTRGMAALPLGSRKINSSFQTLCDMALKDESSYARRCAAYALGMLGNPAAKSVLEKALKDKNEFVSSNAQAALTMLNAQVRLPEDVIKYIMDIHMEAYKEAQAEGLPVNAHIYGVDDQFNLHFGGLNIVKNKSDKVITDEIALGTFSYADLEVMNETGAPQKVRFVDRKGSSGGRYRLMWTPDKPLKPGGVRLLGWKKKATTKLAKTTGGFQLKMHNYFGSPVLESFFLVVPPNVAIASKSTDYASRKRIGSFDVYHWRRTVPVNTTNRVDVVLKKKPPVAYLPLNTVVERKVFDDGAGREFIIDFDTGKLYAFTEEDKKAKITPQDLWDRGFDGGAETAAKGPGLFCANMIVVPLTNDVWKTDSLAGILDDIERGKPGTPVVMSAIAPLPRTYAFKTSEGSIGLLQILEVVNEAPRHINIRYKLLRHPKEAISATADADRTADQKASIHLANRAWYLWNQRKLEESEKIFTQAVEKDPKNSNAWNGLGWALQNQGKKEAADAFTKCIALEPKNSGALNGMGWIAKGLGNDDEAIMWWQKAVVANPQTTAALRGMATTLMARGQYHHAAVCYAAWVRVDPNNKEIKAELDDAMAKAKVALTESKKALVAAEKWLALLDDGKYAESWDTSAELFRKGVTKTKWAATIKGLRAPLGKVESRVKQESDYRTSLPGSPDGEYVVIPYKTTFANREGAIETVTPMKDKDGKWRVSGYYIK